MAKIIQLDEYRMKGPMRAGAAVWRLHFSEPFAADMRLDHLSPETLCKLAEPGSTSATILYALIIGLKGYGDDIGFDELGSRAQNTVLDLHLFLSDQIRFEMMFRLGWLETFCGRRYPLAQMVLDFKSVNAYCLAHPPYLSRSHPDYAHYNALFEKDQQVFIRQKLLVALEAFKLSEQL